VNDSGITRAMILAAGKGKRLRPITHKTPKPLVKVGGKTLIDWTLERLADANVEDVVINLHHLGDQIQRHLGERTKPAITFSPEAELLETGGGVLNALALLGDGAFFTINGDALWLNDGTDALQRLRDAWDDARMDALLLLHSTVDAYGYTGAGDFTADAGGLLTRRTEGEVSPYLFTGIQVLHPRLFRGVKPGRFSLNVLYDRAIEAGRLYGIVYDGEWFHIGTAEGLVEAETYLSVRYPGIKRR